MSDPGEEPASVDAAKQSMRAEALVRMAQARQAGAGLGASFAGSGVIAGHEVVAGFLPLGDEIDLTGLLLGLLDAGTTIVLPETTPRGQPLVFRRWRPGVRMLPGRYGTAYPASDAVAPTLLLVPLLAFDRRCNRLGHGGGYYDRTIAGLPGVRTMGCAYAAQEVDAVPVLPHDAPLDAIATEAGVMFRPEG